MRVEEGGEVRWNIHPNLCPKRWCFPGALPSPFSPVFEPHPCMPFSRAYVPLLLHVTRFRFTEKSSTNPKCPFKRKKRSVRATGGLEGLVCENEEECRILEMKEGEKVLEETGTIPPGHWYKIQPRGSTGLHNHHLKLGSNSKKGH